MPLAPNMTGQDMYNAMSTLVEGFSMDPVLFYQLLNSERQKVEFMRPWMRLRKLDTTQTAIASQPSLIAPPTVNKLTLPTDFSFLNRDGVITLYDQNNQWENYIEIPMDLMVTHLQNNNEFFIDHANGTFTILGVVSKNYSVFMFYQADYGDITASTTWLNIPSRYHLALPLAVAIRLRMGISYDDINSRNASDNQLAYNQVIEIMKTWDDNLQRSATTKRNLPDSSDVPGANFQHKINMNQ